MPRQFSSSDTVKWRYGFGYGQYDATIGDETASWNGTTRFQANGAITGTAGQTSFVKPVGWGHAGFCLLHQTRGTGAGNWELAWVNFSGASAVADQPLQNTYSAGAQAITLSNSYVGYNNVTIGGTFVAPAWDGTTGGICAILARGTVTVTGALHATGKGFRGGSGGSGIVEVCDTGDTGESQTSETIAGGSSAFGDRPSPAVATNGIAGQGAQGSRSPDRAAGGGGGGHASAGGAGTMGEANYIPSVAVGGTTIGTSTLTTAYFGGGGGGGGKSKDPNGQGGGNAGAGGGLLFIIARNFVCSSASYVGANGGAGQNGVAGNGGGGGGGAGGSVLIKCGTATIGTNKVTAPGGTGGTGQNNSGNGGAGGSGRLRLEYALSLSGTSTGLSSAQDKTLKYPHIRRSVV
jgi:hypothetical protein